MQLRSILCLWILIFSRMALANEGSRVPATPSAIKCKEKLEHIASYFLPGSREEVEKRFGPLTPIHAERNLVALATHPVTGRTTILKMGNSAALAREDSNSSLLYSRYNETFPDKPNPFPRTEYHPDLKVLEIEPARGDLEAELDRFGPSHMERTLAALDRMSEAVAFANDLEVIHRDIKPKNFLVMADGRLVLSDWELAARLDERVAKAPSAIVGTSGYRSKHQQLSKIPSPVMDAYALRVSMIEVTLGQELYSPQLERLGFTKTRNYPFSSETYASFTRSPHSIDPKVPVALSVALWHPAQSAAELRERLDKARPYFDGKSMKEYFQRVFSPDFNSLCKEDAPRAALELLTSTELMDAARNGWLELDNEAKHKLWEASLRVYQPRGNQDMPACDAPPLDPIRDSPFETRLEKWHHYHASNSTRQFVRGLFLRKPPDPF